MIRGAVCGMFLMGGTLLAEGGQPLTQELKLGNGGFPQKIELELDSPSHVALQVVQFPKGATFFAEFPKGQGHLIHGDAGQARLSAGRHTITIRERWNKKITGPIHIKAVVTPENDATEPNNTPAQARPVTLGETVLHVFPRGDVDYLKIDLKDRGYLSVYPVNPPKGFTSYCEVYDSNNQSIGANYVHVAIPGEYTLKCMDRWSRFGSTAPVKMRIEFHPEEDPAEPNNITADAADIPLGVWQQAMVAPSGDIDFHALDIKSEGKIVLRVEDLDKNVSVGTQIYDANGKELKLAYPYPVTPGKYYVKVYGRYNKWSLKPYRLKFDLLPIEKITPPGAEKATVIDPSLKYYTRIHSGSETDRFALRFKGPSIAHVRLNVPEGSDYRISYQLKGGKPATGSWTWFRTSEPEVAFTIKPYYNKVSYRPVSVWTEVEEEFDPSEPNDSSKAPADLELDKPRLFFLYPYKDVDWFKVHIDEPGTYYLHVVQTSEDSSMRFRSLGSSFNDASGKRLSWPSLQSRSYGFTSKAIEVKAAGDYLISISSDGSSRVPLAVGLNKESNLLKPDADDTGALDVFVAGVELKPDVAKRMANMVDAGGGAFMNAEKAEEIGDKLVEITDQIEERSAAVLGTGASEKKSSNMWWLWLVLILVLLAGGAWWMKKKKKEAKD